MSRLPVILVAAALLQACATDPPAPPGPTITMPVHPAWYEGELVYYVTTDVSHADMAVAMQVNHAPRLVAAVPDYPKPPELRTAIARVYQFPGAEQASVFPSIPIPLGPDSADRHYSPLWLVFRVTWLAARDGRELRSEAAVLEAAERGLVRIERTNVLVNCPVVATGDGTSLPGTVLHPGG